MSNNLKKADSLSTIDVAKKTISDFMALTDRYRNDGSMLEHVSNFFDINDREVFGKTTLYMSNSLHFMRLLTKGNLSDLLKQQIGEEMYEWLADTIANLHAFSEYMSKDRFDAELTYHQLEQFSSHYSEKDFSFLIRKYRNLNSYIKEDSKKSDLTLTEAA